MKNYWITVVLWQFWAWKTFNIFWEAYKFKKKYWENCVIIWNIPYNFVDILFDSVDDFKLLNSYLVNYVRDTNDDLSLKKRNFKKIMYIIDEAVIYLDPLEVQRSFPKDVMRVFMQCRKRDISIFQVSQDLSFQVKRTRIVSKIVRKYYHFLWGFYRDFELLTNDSTDLKDERVAEQIGWWMLLGMLAPNWLKTLFHPFFVNYFLQRHLTNYVVGFSNKFNMTYEEFKEVLLFKDEEKWKK